MNNSKRNKNLCAMCDQKFSLFNQKLPILNGDKICQKCAIETAGILKKNQDKLKDMTLDQVISEKQKNEYEKENGIGKYNEEARLEAVKNLEEALGTTPAVKCPYCSSLNVEFMQNSRKSFSVGKAVAGTALTGGIGALAGFAGKKGDNEWHCRDCGKTFSTK